MNNKKDPPMSEEFLVYQWVNEDAAKFDMPADEIIQALADENQRLHEEIIRLRTIIKEAADE